MAIEDKPQLSRKRLLAEYQDGTAPDVNQSSRKRIRISDGSEDGRALDPQRIITDEEPISQSPERGSTISPPVHLPTDGLRYLSFGEGAAFPALDIVELTRRLYELPSETEYVVQGMPSRVELRLLGIPDSSTGSPSRGTDSNATEVISPTEYRRSPPAEIKIRNERIIQEWQRGNQIRVSPAHPSPNPPNPATQTILTAPQNTADSPRRPDKERGRVKSRAKDSRIIRGGRAQLSGPSIGKNSKTKQLRRGPITERRAGGTVWEGRLRSGDSVPLRARHTVWEGRLR
ncbi:MAG: hypothetical protein M1840_005353 [Geoglossum simile]|nr:MAG: hypothetical protein M1840_005353 [Geoglossum simile]